MDLKTGWNSVIQESTETGGTRRIIQKTGTPTADYKWVLRKRIGGEWVGGGDWEDD
jgi:hypothetical protein